jgi:hypothetical protein
MLLILAWLFLYRNVIKLITTIPIKGVFYTVKTLTSYKYGVIMRNLFYAFLFLFSSTGLSGTIDPNIPDHKYVEYGQKYECVVGVCGSYEDNTPYCASAVIIKPRWILTAAHVVKGSKTCFVRINNEKKIISKVIPHKDYEEDNFGYYDIALGYLNEDLVISAYPKLYDNNDEEGRICAMVGVGLTGTFETGCVISDNQKRGGSNIIDKIDRHLLVCTPSRQHNKTELEFLIGSGDSGGGLFIDGKLAGINSCVMAIDGKPNSTYTDESGHTRISKHKIWIENTINDN